MSIQSVYMSVAQQRLAAHNIPVTFIGPQLSLTFIIIDLVLGETMLP